MGTLDIAEKTAVSRDTGDNRLRTCEPAEFSALPAHSQDIGPGEVVVKGIEAGEQRGHTEGWNNRPGYSP